jgi:F-type H+-transporting ATPase subunit gamma
MANIKELKSKIRSTKGTLKITTAMKLVAAAKLNKAQQAILQSRPYSTELEKIIKTAAALSENYSHPYFKKGDSKKKLVLVISANKGLCGGYNSNLAKKVREFQAANGDSSEYAFAGKKVRKVIEKDVVIFKNFVFASNEPTFFEIEKVAQELAELFKNDTFGEVYVAYNSFNSAISFTPTIKKVLPFELNEDELKAVQDEMTVDFIYEPSKAEILDQLIPEAYVNIIYVSFLNAFAAEHGSRMAAMDSATKNCKEAIRVQTLTMNKLRQAAITTELIEVVSGAESLNG